MPALPLGDEVSQTSTEVLLDDVDSGGGEASGPLVCMEESHCAAKDPSPGDAGEGDAGAGKKRRASEAEKAERNVKRKTRHDCACPGKGENFECLATCHTKGARTQVDKKGDMCGMGRKKRRYDSVRPSEGTESKADGRVRLNRLNQGRTGAGVKRDATALLESPGRISRPRTRVDRRPKQRFDCACPGNGENGVCQAACHTKEARTQVQKEGDMCYACTTKRAERGRYYCRCKADGGEVGIEGFKCKVQECHTMPNGHRVKNAGESCSKCQESKATFLRGKIEVVGTRGRTLFQAWDNAASKRKVRAAGGATDTVREAEIRLTVKGFVANEDSRAWSNDVKDTKCIPGIANLLNTCAVASTVQVLMHCGMMREDAKGEGDLAKELAEFGVAFRSGEYRRLSPYFLVEQVFEAMLGVPGEQMELPGVVAQLVKAAGAEELIPWREEVPYSIGMEADACIYLEVGEDD